MCFGVSRLSLASRAPSESCLLLAATAKEAVSTGARLRLFMAGRVRLQRPSDSFSTKVSGVYAEKGVRASAAATACGACSRVEAELAFRETICQKADGLGVFGLVCTSLVKNGRTSVT